MNRLQYMHLAKWSFVVWVIAWAAFGFIPNNDQSTTNSEAISYLILCVWLISYWVLHVSFAKAKGYFVSTGIGHSFLPILGLILLALKKDRPL